VVTAGLGRLATISVAREMLVMPAVKVGRRRVAGRLLAWAAQVAPAARASKVIGHRSAQADRKGTDRFAPVARREIDHRSGPLDRREIGRRSGPVDRRVTGRSAQVAPPLAATGAVGSGRVTKTVMAVRTSSSRVGRARVVSTVRRTPARCARL
jgi:hypothetical protein